MNIIFNNYFFQLLRPGQDKLRVPANAYHNYKGIKRKTFSTLKYHPGLYIGHGPISCGLREKFVVKIKRKEFKTMAPNKTSYDFLSISNSNSVVILNRFGDTGH